MYSKNKQKELSGIGEGTLKRIHVETVWTRLYFRWTVEPTHVTYENSILTIYLQWQSKDNPTESNSNQWACCSQWLMYGVQVWTTEKLQLGWQKLESHCRKDRLSPWWWIKTGGTILAIGILTDIEISMHISLCVYVHAHAYECGHGLLGWQGL